MAANLAEIIRKAEALRSQEAQPEPDYSQFNAGLRGSVATMGAQGNAALASGARALGFDQFAAGRDQAVQQGMAEAQDAASYANAPTWDQAKGLRGVLDFGAYHAGALAPGVVGGVGAGIAGGLAAGPVGAIAAPTALFAPVNAGDIALRQADSTDPEIQALSPQEKFGRAAVGGVATSALENVMGGGLGGRVVGKGFGAHLGRNMVLGPLEQGAAEAASEAGKQVTAAPNAPLNTEAITDAGIGGAVVGGVFGAGHMGVNAMQGMPGRFAQGAKDAVGGAKEMASGALKTGQKAAEDVEVPQGAKDAWSSVVELADSAYKGAAESDLGKTLVERTAAVRKMATDLINDPTVPEEWKANIQAGTKDAGDKAYQGLVWAANKLREAKGAVEESGAADAAIKHLKGMKNAATSTFENIRNGVFGGDKDALARATPDQAKRMLDDDQRSNASKLHDWLEGFKDKAETPEERANAERMQAGLADPATHAEAAKFADDRSYKDAFLSKLQALTKGFDKTQDTTDTKKSEDFSGVETAIRQHLLPEIKSDPRLFELLKSDPKVAQGLAANIRKWIATAAREQKLPVDKDGRPENMAKFKLDVAQKRINDRLIDVLGNRTGPILTAIYREVKGKDPAEIERVFGHIKNIGEKVTGYRSVEDSLVKLLPKGSPHWKDLQSGATAQRLIDWANSKDATSTNQKAVEDAEVHAYIKDIWGKNADKVYAELEAHVDGFQSRPDAVVSKTNKNAREFVKETDEQDTMRSIEKYDRDEQIAQDSKNPDGTIKEMFAGKGDSEGQDSVAPHEHGPGIAGLLEHPDVQRGKYKSGESYTEAKLRSTAKDHPNHEFKFFSMREHQKLQEETTSVKDDKGRHDVKATRDAVTSDMRERYPELRDVPEEQWGEYGYLRGTNKGTGKDVKYLGLDHNGKSHAKKAETVGSLFRSPESEKASGVPHAQSSTARMIKDFQNRYPGYNVSFVSLKDYMKSTSKTYAELMEQHGDDAHFPESEDRAGEAGYLKIQGRDRDVAGIAPYEMRKIKLDSRAFSDSPSRLEVGAGLYDAVALTSTFMRKAGHDATSTTLDTDMHRIKEAFLTGYAALLDHEAVHFNRQPEGEQLNAGHMVPLKENKTPSQMLGNMDPDTVIAYRTGRKVTVGDISRDLGSRIRDEKLTAEQTKLAEHFGEMTRGQLNDLYRKAWTTEEATKDALHAAAVDHLEGSKMATGDYRKALNEYKQAHRDDAAYRLSERERWSNALYNALHKDQGFRDEVLGHSGTTEPRPGDMVDRREATPQGKGEWATSTDKAPATEALPTTPHAEYGPKEVWQGEHSLTRTGVDRSVQQGHQRLRIEALRTKVAERERMIAGLQKRLEGEENPETINRINARIDHFTKGRRMFPDKDGNMPKEPMPSLRDLKDQLAKFDSYDATTPNPAKLDSMMKHIETKQSELNFKMREIADLEKRQAKGEDVGTKLAEAHERLTPVKAEIMKWEEKRAELAQERIHHSGDPYGPGGSGKREGDPHGDIHTTSALFSKGDIVRLTDMDGQFRDARYGKNPNVYEHNQAITETKGQIGAISKRLDAIDSALKREKNRSDDREPAVDVRALNAERIKLLAQKSKLQDRKNEFIAQNGSLTPEGIKSYGKALDARVASFEAGWKESKMTATKSAMIKDIKARVEKLKGYADVLHPELRNKLMHFAAPEGRIVNVTEANDHLTNIIKGAAQAIREKDYKAKKVAETAPPAPEDLSKALGEMLGGTPNPKAVAAKKAAFLERAASGDATLIKEISESGDAKGLQRALQVLRTPGQIGDHGRPMRQVPEKFRENARNYLDKVLGDKAVDMVFDSKHLGENVGGFHAMRTADQREVIVTHDVSDSYKELRSFIYHESAHALFARMLNSPQYARSVETLVRVATSGHVQRQLDEIYKYDRGARNHYRRNPEESVAYMYEHWADGTLTITDKPVLALFERVKEVLHQFLRILSDEQHTDVLFRMFKEGNLKDTFEPFGGAELHAARDESVARGFMKRDSVSNVIKTADAINERIQALRDADPTLDYQILTKKYSLMSAAIHEDLERPGFGATHDSPIKHEGKFDWRKWIGKGEGNAAFGAGTYLSTADGVHQAYKNKFTADVRSKSPERTALREKFYDAHRDLIDLKEAIASKDQFVMQWDIARPGEAQELAYQSFPTMADATAGRKRMLNDYQERIQGRLDQLKSNDPKTNMSAVQSSIKYLERMKRQFMDDSGITDRGAELPALEAKVKALEKQLDALDVKSPTYHVSVDIPREKLLDWDKPASNELLGDPTVAAALDADYHVKGKYYTEDKVTGADVYRALTMQLGYSKGIKGKEAQAAASEYLQSLGILGHQYNASGGKNEYHRNYVIYDDSKITTNYVHFSGERVDPNATGPTQNTHKDLLDQMHKTLGNTVQLAMADIMHAGEFSRTNMGDLISLSVHSLNPMGTLHHESLHAFFQQLRDKGLPEIANVVERMANSPMVMKQLRERLAHSPEALAQLRDPEERAAYAYQFWATDKTFKLVGEPLGAFEKIKAFFQKVLGIWTNDERAEHILKYFNSGEYAKNMHSTHAVHDALLNVGKNHGWETMKSIGKPLMDLNDAILSTGGERLRDSGIPSLERLANRVKAKLTDSLADAGYIPAARVARGDWINKLDGYLKGYSKADIQEMWEARQRGEKPVGTKAKIANLMMTKFYKEMREDYLIPAGVNIGDLGPDYAHRVYDSYYISTHQEEFKALLDKYGVNDRVMHSIIANEGNAFGVETGLKTPGFEFGKNRVINEIPHAELAPFLQKDFYASINRYITQATKRGEWAKRFKDDGSGLRAIMTQAKAEGASKAQLQMAENYVQGVNGTLGDTISPDARRLMGNMMVYQNVRLLPLMIFSSVVDPLGIAVRGGTMGDSWNAFKRSARELHKAWQSDPTFDGSTEMARTMGIIENANLNHTMSSMFGGSIAGDTAGHINDTFFKLNFAEQVNQSMRVSAMEAAKRFIVRHADHPSGHSARWLAELGLTKADVKKDANGELLMDPSDTKIKMALNRWVDGAVLRPDAADKPIWMNDPHFALIGHLKQFAFAFQHTILERVMHEMGHGNYRPALVAASYVPVMFAADAAKSIVTSGDVEPDWKKNWTLMDHVGYETQRAGLLGVSQFGTDAMNDIREGGTGVGRLLGPTIEQLVDVAMVAGGRKQFEPVALHAMPANAMYSNWIDPATRGREVVAD